MADWKPIGTILRPKKYGVRIEEVRLGTGGKDLVELSFCDAFDLDQSLLGREKNALNGEIASGSKLLDVAIVDTFFL